MLEIISQNIFKQKYSYTTENHVVLYTYKPIREINDW